ncbi:hypothetical protein GCM10027046_27280 [Uliginosibacterium flavum]|uniref:DUF2502 domain-containing protein n=1 Tax=Uliginosibacterium flavum TaxID=1396831 RepID=A0ABV2TKT6_9RHOO
MKKLILATAMLACPMLSQAADVNIDIGNIRVQAPGVTVTFGSQDSRGYYWDGDAYREPSYWKKHGGPRGKKYYTGRGKNGSHCPPGQAKKGRC